MRKILVGVGVLSCVLGAVAAEGAWEPCMNVTFLSLEGAGPGSYGPNTQITFQVTYEGREILRVDEAASSLTIIDDQGGDLVAAAREKLEAEAAESGWEADLSQAMTLSVMPTAEGLETRVDLQAVPTKGSQRIRMQGELQTLFRNGASKTVEVEGVTIGPDLEVPLEGGSMKLVTFGGGTTIDGVEYPIYTFESLMPISDVKVKGYQGPQGMGVDEGEFFAKLGEPVTLEITLEDVESVALPVDPSPHLHVRAPALSLPPLHRLGGPPV